MGRSTHPKSHIHNRWKRNYDGPSCVICQWIISCSSQLNWATLTKEAYAIYMSVKKSTFYLTGHEITLRSDHLPLKKFLRKMTLNNMVNNWSTEIESFNINFVHISGKVNVLADTLSRLIDTNLDLNQQPELEGHEFGKYCFEALPKARGSVNQIKISCDMADVCEIQITYDNPKNSEILVELPLDDKKFASLQENDPKIWDLHDKVEGRCAYNEFYFVNNNVLFRSIVDNGHKFEVRVIPESLRDVVLHLGHNQSGHNGYQKDICCYQVLVLLERYESTSSMILQKL